jgi:hypothetical protein
VKENGANPKQEGRLRGFSAQRPLVAGGGFELRSHIDKGASYCKVGYQKTQNTPELQYQHT